MIVALDTNVIIRALLSKRGAPAKNIDFWETESFDVAISKPLLEELVSVLGYSKIQRYFKQIHSKTDRLLRLIGAVAIEVAPDFELKIILEDPDDNRVLECAVSAQASYIISGDKHLLGLRSYRGIQILSPIEFVTLFELDKSGI